MEQKQIIKIVSKSIGLLCLVYAFLDIKQILIYGIYIDFTERPDGQSLSYVGQITLGFALDIALASILIYKSELISTILSKGNNERLELGVSKYDLIQLVIIFIGVMAIVDAIPEILKSIAQYLYFNEFGREEMGRYWEASNRKPEVIYLILKLLTG